MMRKLYFTFLIVMVSWAGLLAQSGTIKGKVVDASTNEPLPFANVVVELNGNQAGGSQTDFDGNFTIKPLNPGKYNLKASYVGYQPAGVNNIIVSAEKITFQDVKMSKGAVDITQITITEYKVPVIEKGNPSTQNTMTSEDIQAAPVRDVNSLVATSAGVFQKKEGDGLNIRGSRDNATDYYVDGIRVRGSVGLPQSGIEQITTVTGGIPANYGDATGGIVNITTRGPSKNFNGGVELVTSQFLDPYGFNLVGLNISGPLAMRKASDGTKSPLLGFFISAEFQHDKDPNPSGIGFYKVKDDILEDLRKNPIQKNASGLGFIRRAELTTLDDLERIKAYDNVKATSARLTAKIDFQPSKNITIAFGASGAYSRKREFTYQYALFNAVNNPQLIDYTWRAFARFTHRLSNPDANQEKSASNIKNAFYNIQVDYTQEHKIRQDDVHKDNIFDYGYIGNFKSIRSLVTDTVAIKYWTSDTTFQDTTVYATVGYIDDSLQFSPGNVNNDAQAYTQQYYNLFGAPTNINQLLNDGALINGVRADPVYSLAWNTGREPNSYRVDDNTSLRVLATGSADIKNHNIQLGFEYEQRTDAFFASAPIGLWNKMRGLQNIKWNLTQKLNEASYNGQYWELFHYAQDGQIGFYENIRNVLGKKYNELIDIDSYDPSVFKLEYFTADELLLPTSLVDYAGYTYYGERQKNKPSFKDYFSKVDSKGNPTREIAPFQPIYMAGFIQDRFAINDLIFNVGVRVDRFDANQKVLKDKYSLYATKTAGEVNIPNRPGGIGDDYVVYVADAKQPSAGNVIGYRNGDDWYDANGIPVTDPSVLAKLTTTGILSPWLVNVNDDVTKTTFDATTSFKDYEPQITFMPRIAFSFPISDMAQFFAHYDILTQRPPDRWRITPLDYFQKFDGVLNNPALKPEKTVDYELGFKQALSRSSAISISAFYREFQDQIQQRRINFAYPNSYVTYDNFDFGTAKGLNFSYDLRRTSNVRLTLAYTLQFADGTGSGDASQQELINLGQPNLRTVNPLDFDQRHTFVTTMDYRYMSGADYNGPVWFGKQFFANTGVNVIFRAGSGTPYSALQRIRNEVDNIGLQQSGTGALKGSINGSRLPWQYRVDIRIDKTVELKKAVDGASGMSINIYLQLLNALNAENVVDVYRATGNPDDDGFLSSSSAQPQIASAIDERAYRDLYGVMMRDPANYSLPRRIRLGVELQF